MKTISLYRLLKRPMLVTRQAARSVAPDIGEALTEGRGEITLDFFDIKGVSPSFLSETLAVVEDCAEKIGSAGFRVVVENPPTKLSSKFIALGRGHRVNIQERDGNTWIITKSGV